MEDEPKGKAAKSEAKKVAFHLEGALFRKLIARAAAAGMSDGLMAKQLVKESLEGAAVLTSQAELHRLAEEVENLKLAVESLRAEVVTTLSEDRTTPELKPLLQELRTDIATALVGILGLMGHPKEKIEEVMMQAFPKE